MFKPVKLLGEVMALAYLVNANTEYCTFIDHSGHVEAFKIRIFPNKVNCTEDKPIHESYFYIDGRHRTDSEKELSEIKSTLESYLYPNTDELEVRPCMN